MSDDAMTVARTGNEVDPADAEDWWDVTSRLLPWLIPIILAIAVGSVVTALIMRDGGGPGDRSADAGFARDMSTHHAQAVQMAGIVYQRTEDPEIRYLAYDILTSQQAQIGMMSAWLDMWGLSPTSLERPMTWMGHAMDGPMPGMATAEQVRALETLPPAEMDREFLRLMIEHHKGGVDMANAGVELGSEEQVRSLAKAIADSQQNEIRSMQQMLDQRS